MKKITQLSIGTGLALLLFYNQDFGVNLSMLVLVTWALQFYSSQERHRDRIFWMFSVSVFLTSFAYAWFGDVFTFFATLSSILAFGIYSQYPRFNFVLYPLIIALNYVSFIFRVFFISYWLPSPKANGQFLKKLIAWILIPLIFTLVFLGIYISGSSVFQDFFHQFSLDFNFLQIVFILGIAFFFFFNLWFPFLPKELIRVNRSLKTTFSSEDKSQFKPTFSFLDIDFERKSGIITLITLNILLLLFILAYNYEQFFKVNIGGNLSQEIHDRVSTIIFSIVMAIIVIMYYFKSAFNFDIKADSLRKLANVWILLNTILIFSALIKNGEYISHYGLTYKRVGVYIFLLLSLIGLVFTFLKLKNKETNFYLINRMFWVFYTTFVFCSLINFSWLVTKYNIAFHKNTDIIYLRSLEFNQQILFNTFHNDPDWKQYFESNQLFIKSQKENSALSAKLYYYWINWNAE